MLRQASGSGSGSSSPLPRNLAATYQLSSSGIGIGIGQRPTPTQHPPPTVRANVGRLVIGAVRASGPYSFRPTGVIYTRLRAFPPAGRHSRATAGAEEEGAAGSTLVRLRARPRIRHHPRTQNPGGMRDRSARSPMPTYDMCSGWWWIEATKKPLPAPLVACGAGGAPPPRS